MTTLESITEIAIAWLDGRMTDSDAIRKVSMVLEANEDYINKERNRRLQEIEETR